MIFGSSFLFVSNFLRVFIYVYLITDHDHGFGVNIGVHSISMISEITEKLRNDKRKFNRTHGMKEN